MDALHAARAPGPSFDARRGATPGPGAAPSGLHLAIDIDPTPVKRTTGLGNSDSEGWQEVPRHMDA